ncbi:MAG: YihA family ribosome biogenesis GTP-binding protein [Proteobacteria bacterium]|nr:YihA family ribosome biogenesis GTP-binding protein [Pseudomonadota bacterium]
MRHIQHIQFIGSFPQAPEETDLPEIAFVGRSNVGKSSAINALLARKKAARVSSRPGRTQGINMFMLDEQLLFVDLPGYGFAKVPVSVKNAWKGMMEGYLFGRSALKLVVVLVDGRHSAQKSDLQLLETFQREGVPHLVVSTKIDRIKRSKRAKHKRILQEGLGIKDIVSFSSETKEGVQKVWDVIEQAIIEP